jgi:hypothetical protein
VTDQQPLDLEPIRQRADQATPGPWLAASDNGRKTGIAVVGRAAMRGTGKAIAVFAGVDGDRHADAAFTAHARDDVPALIAEVERLRAQLAADPPGPLAVVWDVERLVDAILAGAERGYFAEGMARLRAALRDVIPDVEAERRLAAAVDQACAEDPGMREILAGPNGTEPQQLADYLVTVVLASGDERRVITVQLPAAGEDLAAAAGHELADSIAEATGHAWILADFAEAVTAAAVPPVAVGEAVHLPPRFTAMARMVGEVLALDANGVAGEAEVEVRDGFGSYGCFYVPAVELRRCTHITEVDYAKFLNSLSRVLCGPDVAIAPGRPVGLEDAERAVAGLRVMRAAAAANGIQLVGDQVLGKLADPPLLSEPDEG